MHHVALKFVDAVERFGSIRAAARYLNVESSSITRQIQKIEHSFGAQLFERSSDGVSPTKAGEVVLAHVKRTLRDLERTRTQIQAIAGPRDALIHIVTVDSVTSTFLPVLLTEYLGEHPGVRFNVSEFSSNRVWQELLDREADVAINFLPIETDQIEQEATFGLELGVVCARDHPLASHDVVNLTDALQYPLVATSISAPIFDEVRDILLKVQKDTRPWVETDSTSMVKNLIESGRFIAIRTYMHAIGYDVSSIRTIWRPVQETLPSERMIIGTRTSQTLSETLTSFLDYLRTFIKKGIY